VHWPLFPHEGIMVLRLSLHDLEFILEMSWQVTVMGVLYIFGREHNCRFIVLVKLSVGLQDVVFNTITISVVDSVGA